MPSIKYVSSSEIFTCAASRIKQTNIILDIGCGIKPTPYIKPKLHICCEPYAEYLQHLKQHAPKDREFVLINSTWDIIKHFPAQSVDTVIFTDVIEHLKKEEGKMLIKEAERVAKVQVILFTPLGFMPQQHPDGKDAWGFSGGKWQEHHSGWDLQDFDDPWELIVCQDLYDKNNVGQALSKPHGAFWAILNKNGTGQAEAISVLYPGK
ncbi:methyltransferase domain-containing protein [Fictibacillus iocasae]|uniref:Methyltransferase domain-containing protein n=1 Tax=Fictibacillus iocasae TaxID=2715437 RepID=A0ABW2NX99_9BACL